MTSANGENQLCDRVSVNLRLWDVDPDDVTRILGIEPSFCWRKGEVHPRISTLVREEHMWSVKSPLYQKGTLREQLDALISLLTPCIDKLNALPPHMIWLECSFYTEQKPCIELTRDDIAFLAEINAEPGFDINYWEDPYESSHRDVSKDMVAVSIGITSGHEDQIAESLAMQPRYVRSEVESLCRLKRPSCSRYAWEYGSVAVIDEGDEELVDDLFEEQVGVVIQSLMPISGKLACFANQGIYLECLVCAYHRPGVSLRQHPVNFLSSINAGLRIDVNYYEDQDLSQ